MIKFNKKQIFISLSIIILSLILLIINSASIIYKPNPKDNIVWKIRTNIHYAISEIPPRNIKTLIKLFVDPNSNNLILVNKDSLKNKDYEIAKLRKEVEDKNKDLNNRLNSGDYNKILFYFNNPKYFKFVESKNYTKYLGNNLIKVTEYSLPLLNIMGPRSYFAVSNKELFLISGNGKLFFNTFDNLEKNKFTFKLIDTNFEKLVGKKYIRDHRKIVKGILYENKKIYVSYLIKVRENCYANAVLVGKINYNFLEFNEFFSLDQCTIYPETQAGGTLSSYKDNKIIMTIGDHNEYKYSGIDYAQELESLYGKIITIDKLTGSYEIISMGHRNPQGLYFDKGNNIIFSAEHGPQGGDEININFKPGGEVENFGWGHSSYGEHYGFPDKNNEKLYAVTPLKKSHKDYGFIEPFKFFTPSIAPSQIIKNNDFIKYKDKHVLYLGSMGGDIYDGSQSIHQFILDKNYNLEEHNSLVIGSRVRDIIFIEKINKFFIYIEGEVESSSESSIALLELVK